MPVLGDRSVTVQLTGDITYTQIFRADENVQSPGAITTQNLTTGFNVISIPTGGAVVPTAATILPPDDNEETLTLKGISADTGIPIHPTDPCSISLASSLTTFGITASGTVTGLRIIWS